MRRLLISGLRGAALALLLAGAAGAADAPGMGVLRGVDKAHGEEREIAERVEWFKSRRGLDDAPAAAAARARAVTDLRRTLAGGMPALLADESWQPLGPDGMTMLDWAMGRVAGRVSALAVDPGDEDHVWLGAAAGGLWETTDGGQSWQQRFDQIGTESIGSILIEDGAPDHVWVGTGEADAGCLDYFGMGLFYSADGGQTFEPRNGDGDTAMPLSFVTALAQSPLDHQLLLVGGKGHCNESGSSGSGGIFRSADAGQTWTQVFVASSVRDLLFDPLDGATVYASIRSKGIYKSTDAGQTWNLLDNGLPVNSAAANSRIAMAPGDPAILYALVGASNGANLQLYRSGDAGASWTEVNDDTCEGQCSYNLTLDVNPVDPDQLLVGTIRPALSTDGGSTLTLLTAGWGGQQSVHQDTHIVRYSRNDGNRFWIGSDGGLWRSDDGGGSFANLNANLEITQFYDIAIDPDNPDRVFGGAQDNSSSRGDGDLVWDVTEVTGDGFMNAIDPDDGNRVFQTSYPNSGGAMLILSTDAGAPDSYQWVSQSGFDGSEPFAWVTPLVAAGGSVFVASNRIYRAPIGDDAGAYQWSPVSDNLGGSVSVLTPAPVTSSGTMRVYAGTSNGHIWTSADALADAPQWSDVTASYPHGNVSDIAVDRDDETRVFVTRSAFAAPHLFRSNGSADWDTIGDGLPGVPANSVAIDPLDGHRIFVGTDIGVFVSDDDGATFAPFMAGLPLGIVVTDLEISLEPHVLVAGTYGRGAWKVTLAGSDAIFRSGFDEMAPPGR